MTTRPYFLTGAGMVGFLPFAQKQLRRAACLASSSVRLPIGSDCPLVVDDSDQVPCALVRSEDEAQALPAHHTIFRGPGDVVLHKNGAGIGLRDVDQGVAAPDDLVMFS